MCQPLGSGRAGALQVEPYISVVERRPDGPLPPVTRTTSGSRDPGRKSLYSLVVHKISTIIETTRQKTTHKNTPFKLMAKQMADSGHKYGCRS
jgi:hypothetical protein